QTQPTAEPPAANQPEAGSNAAANNPYAAAGIDDPEAFEAIFDQIKSAVAGGDKDKVADYVLFPMRLNTAKANTIIKNKEDFINKYDAILTAPVKKALANQKIDSLFVNDQGVMVGNGEMWFGATAGSPQKYGIIAVNHDTVGTD
ncbi:hypothetical protein K0U00_24405, partial [Paenibacillus sepulcri]|nr:hypothetical protein [Paenibacillus sepulcri]